MVGLYFTAIWTDMVARMSGLASLALTVLGAFSQYFSGTIGPYHVRAFLWIAAALCFAFANYRVWADEHKKVVSAQPRFLLNIENVRWEYIQGKNRTVFIFAVGIINQGAASITSGWFAKYNIAGSSIPMNRIGLVDEWTLRHGTSVVTIRPEDQIINKTTDRRVETGDGKQGRIFFWLSGDHLPEIRSLQFTVEIGFYDFLGKPWRQTFIPSADPVTSLGMYPGEHGMVISDVPNSELAQTHEESPKQLDKPQ